MGIDHIVVGQTSRGVFVDGVFTCLVLRIGVRKDWHVLRVRERGSARQSLAFRANWILRRIDCDAVIYMPELGPENLLFPENLLERWPFERHLEQYSGAPFCRLLSVSVDMFLDTALQDGGVEAYELSVVGLGGYGRFELAPGADIDILVLTETLDTEGVARVLQPWVRGVEAAGFAPSIRTSTTAKLLEEADKDIKAAVTLLDTRHIAGDPDLFGELSIGFEEQILQTKPEQLVRFLRSETELRRERLRSHWNLLEPDVKLSEGGLRDFHAVRWIREFVIREGAEVSDGERVALREAHGFLLWLRNVLRITAQETEERLSLESQALLVQSLKKTPESHYQFDSEAELLDAYHRHARDVAWVLRRWLALGDETLHARGAKAHPDRRVPSEAGVVIRGGRLALDSDINPVELPSAALRLFRCVAHTGLKLHYTAYSALDQAMRQAEWEPSLDDYQVLLDVISLPDHGSKALEQFYDSGLMGRMLPDFEGLKEIYVPDPQRLYTPAVHALRSLHYLRQIAAGRESGAEQAADLLRQKYAQDAVLMFSVLLSPFGSSREDDTPQNPEAIRRILDLFEVDSEQQDEVLFLVSHRRDILNMMQHRDLADEQMFLALAKSMDTVERLDRLFLMSTADLWARNPAMLSSWMSRQLETTYIKARAVLDQGLVLWTNTDAVVERMTNMLIQRQVGFARDQSHPRREEIRKHFERLPTRYALYVSLDDVPLHMDILAGVGDNDNQSSFRLEVRPMGGAPTDLKGKHFLPQKRVLTEVVIGLQDQPGLMSLVASVVAGLEINIREAYAFTTNDGHALVSLVAEGSAATPDHVGRLQASLEVALNDPTGFFNHSVEILRKVREASGDRFKPTVGLVEEPSGPCLGIEIEGVDRRGLLFDVCRAMSECKLNIHLVRIGARTDEARGVLWVSELDGSRPDTPERYQEILDHLKASLEGRA